MGIRFLVLAALLGGMLAGCMSLEKMYITPETQAIVQEKVAGRHYTICIWFRENTESYFYVKGDSLQIETWRRSMEEQEYYRIEDYQQTKTERGATEITFFAVGQDKGGKEVRLACRIRIYAVDKAELYIDETKMPVRWFECY